MATVVFGILATLCLGEWANVLVSPLVIKHGWLENQQFIGDFHNNTSISRGSSIAMFDYQRVSRSYHDWGWFIAAMYGDARDGLLLG